MNKTTKQDGRSPASPMEYLVALVPTAFTRSAWMEMSASTRVCF